MPSVVQIKMYKLVVYTHEYVSQLGCFPLRLMCCFTLHENIGSLKKIKTFVFKFVGNLGEVFRVVGSGDRHNLERQSSGRKTR